jgi:hypothetical protein
MLSGSSENVLLKKPRSTAAANGGTLCIIASVARC